MRASDLALAVFPAIFPRLIDLQDREAMSALAETAGREVKVLVNQQGHSLLARGLYTGDLTHSIICRQVCLWKITVHFSRGVIGSLILITMLRVSASSSLW